MVLVDTSVWVAHLRQGDVGLEALLNAGRVVCHPFIIGELACGHLQQRSEILLHLQALPQATLAGHDEVMQFIENYGLMGKGLGYVDMHLLAAALLSRVSIWTLDRRLEEVTVEFGGLVMLVQTNLYLIDDFIDDVFRIAKEKGFKIETLYGTNVPQIDFGHKKLHEDHVRGLFPDSLSYGANIKDLIERVAPGRPCTHRPFREIIEQIQRKRPKAYEEAIRSQKKK